MTSKDPSKNWQTLINYALKISSQCENQNLFIKEHDINTPWEYLIASWIYPTGMEGQDVGLWEAKFTNSYSKWSEVTRGLRALIGQGMSRNLYDLFVGDLQSITIKENSQESSFWTLERFLILLKPLDHSINVDYAKLLQPWADGNADMLLSLQKNGLSNLPDIQTYLDPQFVKFIETLWSVQGTLQNASALWKENKCKNRPQALELPSLVDDIQCV